MNTEKTNAIVELNDFLERLVNRLFPFRNALIALTSAATIAIAFILAFLLRFDFSFPTEEMISLRAAVLVAIIVKLLVFQLFKLHNVMWRYVSIIDMLRIFLANLTASAALLLIVWGGHTEFFPGFSRSVIVIDFVVCFLLMTGKRVVLRLIRESAVRASGSRTLRTLLVGKIESVGDLIQAFVTTASDRNIIGVLCDEVKIGQTIRGVPVLGKATSAAKCAGKHDASEILLLPPYSNPGSIRTIMEDLENRQVQCELRMVPTYTDVAVGNINVSNIREVEIEDLLGREPVTLDRTDVAEFVKDKAVMVTGAGGSIGSELCAQIASYKPEKLVLFELSEYNMYEINRTLSRIHPDLRLVNVIGDVRSNENVSLALTENNVNVVYHAAAYKHVPLMEENPTMAMDTNVLGTAVLAKQCERAGVARMVMISTDKAVRPTSVMGASKRIAERVVLERPNVNTTEFVVVRFGNVLGSSGSVIPLFKRQIAEGGPVTVTSKNVVRYFMSIPEAVDLVLQAGAIGRDRDIMVLEMGRQVNIYDMARKLIELSGFIPDEDIQIDVIGLRPGEKEYEELLTSEETVDRTPYERIYAAKKSDSSLPQIDLKSVERLVRDGDVKALRELLANCIPENLFSK